MHGRVRFPPEFVKHLSLISCFSWNNNGLSNSTDKQQPTTEWRRISVSPLATDLRRTQWINAAEVSTFGHQGDIDVPIMLQIMDYTETSIFHLRKRWAVAFCERRLVYIIHCKRCMKIIGPSLRINFSALAGGSFTSLSSSRQRNRPSSRDQ